MEERYRCCANCRHYIHPRQYSDCIDGAVSSYCNHPGQNRGQFFISIYDQDSIRRAELFRDPGDWCDDLFEPNERKPKVEAKPIEMKERSPLNNHWLNQQAKRFLNPDYQKPERIHIVSLIIQTEEEPLGTRIGEDLEEEKIDLMLRDEERVMKALEGMEKEEYKDLTDLLEVLAYQMKGSMDLGV